MKGCIYSMRDFKSCAMLNFPYDRLEVRANYVCFPVIVVIVMGLGLAKS